MTTDFFPGFAVLTLDGEKGMHTVPTLGMDERGRVSIPTPGGDDLCSTDTIVSTDGDSPGFKPEDCCSPADAGSQQVARQNRPFAARPATPDLKSEVAKGIGSTDTLRISEGASVFDPHVEYSSSMASKPLRLRMDAETPTLVSNDGAAVLSIPAENLTAQRDVESQHSHRWSAFAFRVRQFACSLSRERRADVARRPRFYSMPFLRRADDPDPEDCLP